MKTSESTINEQKIQFEEIFEGAPYAVFFHDTERIINVNRAFLALYGYSNKEEILDKPPLSTLVVPEDIEVVLTARESAKKGSSVLVPGVRLIKKNGDIFSAEAHVSMIEIGGQRYFQVYSTDVTKSIEANKEMLENGKKYQMVFNNSLDGIYKSTPQGKFVDVNAALVNMLGYHSKEELLSIDIKTDLYFKLEDRKIMAAHEEDQYPLKRKDGTAIWVEDHSYYEYDENGKILFHHGILRDVTTKLEEKKELETLLATTESQNEKLQNFAHIISHNIRSHSANLSTLVEFMENETSAEARSQFLDMLKTSTIKLEETIRNLNEIITVQNLDKPKEIKNLRQEVENTLKIVSGEIIEKKIEVEISIPENLLVNVIPAYLDSILLNLISNAIKYRSVDRESVIEIVAEKGEVETRMTVSDNGIGIDLEKNGEKLFGMYETFHTNEDSRGFGLYITKNQIEAMGGRVDAESLPGEGTSIHVYLPNEK